MPHIEMVYSANLDGPVDLSALCEALRREAVTIDAFPLAGVRVRAIRADHFAIADGNPQHGFIDLSIRLREGRSEEVKKDAIQRIFDAARAYLTPYMSEHPLALSAEIRDINAALSPKCGTIRDHLKAPS
jgi:5-carboxymethyl-2-hydroxymuconate isomerase